MRGDSPHAPKSHDAAQMARLRRLIEAVGRFAHHAASHSVWFAGKDSPSRVPAVLMAGQVSYGIRCERVRRFCAIATPVHHVCA